MKSALSEGKFLLLTLAAIFLLIFFHFFQQPLSVLYNSNNYAGVHTLLEFFSISISMSIFLYGLKNFDATKSSRMLHLSFAFLMIGSIDLLHTLSYNGMPYLFTDSSIAKETWFWVIARVIESAMMLMLIILPNRKMKRDYRGIVLLTGILLTCLVGFLVIHFNPNLPLLFIEGKGTTPFKNDIEYFVCTLQFVSIVILLYQYYVEKSGIKLTITLAFVFLFLSELLFTTYQSVYDLDSFTGHIFKVIGYYYILKGFYFYESSSERDKLFALMKNYPGLIFQLEVRRNECICTFSEGDLLSKDKMVSSELNTIQVFRIVGHPAEEYCLSPGRKIEQKTFIHKWKEKPLFIVIKRISVSDEIRTIIGTILEMNSMEMDRNAEIKV